MSEKNNKNKIFVSLLFGGMALLSLTVAWIMSKNLSSDDSKERFKLTKEYKIVKKQEYHYDEAKGQKVYNMLCAKCHLSSGLGTMQTPPLAGSNIVKGDFKKPIKVILRGLTGKIRRSGKAYNSIMPGFKVIPHEDLAHVLNYIRKSFGNNITENVHTVEIVKMKVDTISQKGPYTEAEL